MVYGLSTVVIPPARPSIRIDLTDAVFWDRASKNRALVDEVARAHGAGRPVLVGTSSVRESEELARALSALLRPQAAGGLFRARPTTPPRRGGPSLRDFARRARRGALGRTSGDPRTGPDGPRASIPTDATDGEERAS